MARIVNSRATQDIKGPLRDMLMSFGIPKQIVIDNEKSLNSAPITHMLQNQYNIEIFRTPPYMSTVNGQIERFHSTLSEIIRCVKAEKVHDSFNDLLNRSIFKYNYSIHSTINRKPVEVFFGRTITTDPMQLEQERQEVEKNLIDKQEKDLEFHNQNRKLFKEFQEGQTIYAKINKRLNKQALPPLSGRNH